MLYWVIIFFVATIVAGIFAFMGIATALAGIAKLLFFIFLLFVISLVMHFVRGHRIVWDRL